MDRLVHAELGKLKEHHFIEKVHMLKALQAQFGESVVATAMESLLSDTRQEWETIGELNGRNDIEELVHILWEHFAKSGGYEFTLEKQPEGVQIICTKCPLADMARTIGEPEWGYRFYCAADPVLVEAFNPEIGLRRTQTLMQGDPCCNHFYYYKNRSDMKSDD